MTGPDGLRVRCGPVRSAELTAADGVDRMVMRGREPAGWLLVRPDVQDDEVELRRWVATGRASALAVPLRRRARPAPGHLSSSS